VSPGTRPGYRHAALFFDSDEDFLAQALPFLQAGLSAGEAGLVVCQEAHNDLLARALPDDAHVLVLPRDAVYTRAAHVGVTYERLVHRLLAEGARGTRLVSEPAYGSEPEAWETWADFESVSNVTLSALRLSSVCGYDVRRLSASMVDDVQRAHPHLLTEDGPVPSGAYVAPADLLGTTPPRPDPLEATPPSLDLEGIPDRAGVARARREVRAVVDAACPDTLVGEEFVGAVAEVVSNAFHYGGPPVHVRVWTTPSRLLCTVTDCGAGADLLFAGYSRGDLDDERTGAGLWLARQTCDRLDAYPTPGGFTVRLSSAVPPVAPGAEGARAQAGAPDGGARGVRLRAAELLGRVE
jgi:anti-sigma regulatory factor (Ser/Thr protein kinase)